MPKGILCAVIMLCGGLTSHAEVLQYDMSYDPTTGATTIFNYANSEAGLEFWTRLGQYVGQDLYLDPGETVMIDQGGNITGNKTTTGEKEKNKEYPTGTEQKVVHVIKVKNTSGPGSVTVDWKTDKGANHVVLQNEGDQVTVPANTKFTACSSGNLTYQFTDCDIVAGAETETTWLSDQSPLPSNQANIELLWGTITSTDETTEFTTIFTPTTATGCPEPSSLVLLTLGLIALLAYAGRRRICKT
jgi:hypothetical protein